MAERVIKFQTHNGEQLGDLQIQGTDSNSSEQIRDTVKALGSAEAFDVRKGTKLAEDELPPTEPQPEGEGTSQADSLNVAKDIAKTLRDALREHGDEMQGIFVKDLNNRGVTIKVTYKPDEQQQQTEDKFVFRWDNGNVRLDNLANPVDLGPIQNKSGRSFIQKDLLKDKLLGFLKSHDDEPAAPSDPGQIPDGQPVQEDLWESEECQDKFCEAVKMYRCSKDKESIKALFRAARPYKGGNTIQEKLKGAVEWYNIFKENPPKNTEKQVFLEDDNDKELFDLIKPLAQDLAKLKEYINRTENVHLGSYYRTMMAAFENLYKNYLGWSTSDLREVWNLEDPVAQGEYTNNALDADDSDPYWSEGELEDQPAVQEGDETGPDVGDQVDYNGGHYKLYGYCGYEVVLQNVNDERDFKIVKPAEIGIGQQEGLTEDTQFIDPEELPDDFGAEQEKRIS